MSEHCKMKFILRMNIIFCFLNISKIKKRTPVSWYNFWAKCPASILSAPIQQV